MDEAQQLFEDVRSSYPHLRMTLSHEHQDPDLLLEIPRQPGLQFDISLYLDGDELHISTGEFCVEWFPCSDATVRQQYRVAVDGILSGEYRIVEHYRRGRAVRAELQKPSREGWEAVATCSQMSIPIPWRTTTRVVQNVPP